VRYVQRVTARRDSANAPVKAVGGELCIDRSAHLLQLADGQVRLVDWGSPVEYLSAAYWVERTKQWLETQACHSRPHRLGGTFAEEVAACLLGGHGITYESNVAAYKALRSAGLLSLNDRADSGQFVSVLSAPLAIADGRTIRYRFPNQKADRLEAAFLRMAYEDPPSDPHMAREWLLTFPGIGLKTASWIVRNRYADADVAIIDVHVMRAGVRAGIFDASWTPARDYLLIESAFLQWARLGEVSASDLDAVMWRDEATSARAGRRVGP
jgi:N-glycosylase/DNA lyase